MIHKTTRSILSVLLAALLLVTSIPLTPAFAGGGGVSLQSESGESRELTGSGAATDPYQIATADDLLEFAQRVNGGETTAYAVLTDDIVLNEKIEVDDNGAVTNQEKLSEWTPIGNSSRPYRGTFDGANYTISGLYIDSNADYQGLFGYVGSSGKVQNLTVSGSVSGNNYVGGVVGQNGGRITDCAFTGSVSGNRSVGGVVGDNCGGSVTNSYNTGSVSGPDSGNSVGGVVGYNYSGGSVTNSYNTGTVTGPVSASGNNSVRAGGVVGYNSSSGIVTNCYNTGSVSGPDSGNSNQVGGVVGQNISGNVTDCYFLKTDDVNKDLQGIGNDSAEGAADVNDLSELCQKFKDDTDTWRIHPVLGRPVLNENKEGGDGSPDSPYEISTATQLENFRDLVNGGEKSAHAKLMNNIDLSSVCGPTLDDGSSVSWTPIGNYGHQYTGTFNGNGHTISGLYINNSTANDQGLFGRVNGGIVQNLSVSGSVSGDWYVGGVVGYNNGGTVTGCIFSGSGSVSGNRYVGGVVGYNSSGTVTNCAFSGTVTGIYVGGVVGENSGSNGSVEKCHNTGSVNGSVNSVGGVVGNNEASVENCTNTGSVKGSAGSSNVGGVVGLNRGSVENCYNTGSVSGDWYVGGVVGRNDGSVKNCYNTGTVTGTVDFVGGVVGQNFGGTVENCYNTGAVSGSGLYVGGVVGDNSGPVKNCYNTGTVSDGTTSGGVVGQNSGSGSVTNCYFLPTADVNVGRPGIGGGSGTSSNVEPRTADAFHSGEVAWLLENGQADGSSQVWGQNIKDGKKDNYPQLRAFDADTPQVYKVAFMNDSEEHDAKYANSGMTVGSPTTNPTKEGYTFAGWFTESSGGSQWNFSTAVTENMTLYAQWTAVEEPTPTPTPDPTPSGPSTGDSTGWDDIRDELENAENGDEITIDMGDETKVPAEIFESLAGKDVEISFDLGDVQWSVNGADIPTDTDFTDLDLGVNLDTSGIPVNVINTITGEVGTVQITLAHDGEFGFTMTLTAPLGKENAGYWANLYHYDEDAEALNFETAAKIDEDGNVTIPFSYASQYAIVIDTHSHAAVDVSDLFIDVAPNAWYKDAVQYAYDNGLMTGTSATTFEPEATTTRAMIVSILARLENVTTAQAAGFADVDDNDWYATAVNWAANVGVVNGYEDNTFKPNTAITREQLAAILMNYAAYKGEDVSNRADLTSYTDQPSTWAEEAMSWAVAEGLINGVTADTLQPQGAATRAQVAAILQRFLSE